MISSPFVGVDNPILKASDHTVSGKTWIYTPLIKQGGFNPSPIAGKIPIYADSVNNPRAVGTTAYREFWEEQIYYCENGYTTGGIYIPGREYHYLNFKIIDGLYGPTYPHFTDLHHELFVVTDWIRVNNDYIGIVIPKKRRAGLSFFGTEIIDYGMKFIPAYRAGIGAGLDTYSSGFRSKLYRTYNNTVPEFRQNHLLRNTEQLKIGYEENTAQGFQEVVEADVLFRTMKDSESKLEGEFFHDVILEEAGEFPLVSETYSSIKPAMAMGENYVGMFYIYGTGGNMMKSSAAFKHIWHEAESLSLYRFFIPAPRFYAPCYRGFKDLTGKPIHRTPNLDAAFPDLEPEQLLGCEDVKEAMISLETQEKRLAENPEKKRLIEHKQDNPKEVQDVFTSSGSNNFNNEKLYYQLYCIESEPSRRYQPYVLEFVKDINGEIVMPLQVYLRNLKREDPQWKYVYIYKRPLPGYRNLDIVGIDGYNEDKTTTTASLGAIVVVRRNDTRNDLKDDDEEGKIIICAYMGRPPRKEYFWEIGLKISILYNAVENTMISAEHDAVIQFYKDNGGRKYLSPRPKSFDAPESQLLHDFGVKMTNYSKPRMLSLIQSWVEDNAAFCWFEWVISDLISYDQDNIGTDWDSGDALGYALMRIIDMGKMAKKADENAHFNILPSFKEVDGNIIEESPRIKKLTTQDKEILRGMPPAITEFWGE